LYLAPTVIEKMIASEKPPALGGETRNVTVFFSDVAGFSSFAERLAPADLVVVMNEYFSAMTEIIQERGGFVDKYIGDAIVAVFGAPFDDRDHAANAVRAAMRCRERLEELNQTSVSLRAHKLAQRIGLNSGDALVGNIGSRQRFNYTVMGDVVNLASRLEGANKYFGTCIVVSETTFDLARTICAWRELDIIRVQGRAEPVKIYEPLSLLGEESPGQTARAEAYAAGLACWRVQDFSGAVKCLARIADSDLASMTLLRRAQMSIVRPPAPGWDAVNTLDGK
jgi:adenylate cyclase